MRGLSTVVLVLVLASCGGENVSIPSVSNAALVAPASLSWIPGVGDSIQIQYDGKLDLGVKADIYDLDMFDTHPSVVSKLHGMGRKVLCYIDVGTWEKWRPDAKDFPKSVLGHKDGHWAGERWLDIRQTNILEPIMGARFQLCKKKGFDGVDPDNIDGYQNKTGFPLTAAEQLTYDEWVADEAHSLDLAVDQKNDPAQLKPLDTHFDFAVDEQCFQQGWCDKLVPYTNENRLVVDIEYTNQMSEQRFLAKACPSDKGYSITGILKKLELTAWIVNCSGSASP
jgi:hypothetical protein